MPAYKHSNGYTYTPYEVAEQADTAGMSLDNFIKQKGFVEVDSIVDPTLETFNYKEAQLGLKDRLKNIFFDNEITFKNYIPQAKSQYVDLMDKVWKTMPSDGPVNEILKDILGDEFDPATTADKFVYVMENLFEGNLWDEDEGVKAKKRRKFQLGMEKIINKKVEVDYSDKFISDQFKIIDKRNKTRNADENAQFYGGNFEDKVVATAQAVNGVLTTIVPAILSGGRTIAPQIMLPMYSDYNIAKAKYKYGENNPDAFSLLAKNDEIDMATPAVLGYVAYKLEKMGLDGIQNHIFKSAFKPNMFVNLLKVGSENGLQEALQGLVNKVNTEKATGSSNVDALKNVMEDTLTSDDFLEDFTMGFVGGTSMSATGSAATRLLQKALKSDPTSRKIVNDYIDKISYLTEEAISTKDPDYKKKLEQKREDLKLEFKDFVKSKNKLADYLTEEQKTEILDILSNSDTYKKEVEKIRSKFNKRNITEQEFKYLYNELNENQNLRDTRLNEIKKDANRIQIEKDLTTVRKAIKKITGLNIYEISDSAGFLKEINKRRKAQGKREYTLEEVSDVDGTIIGKDILINMDVAAEAGAITVGSHELLHAVLRSVINGEDGKITDEGRNLVKQFREELSDSELDTIEERLEDKYGLKRDADGNIDESNFDKYAEEYFNAYVDAAINNDFSDSQVMKLSKYFYGIFKKEAKFSGTFKNGKDMKSFLKQYASDVRSGEVGDVFVKLAQKGVDIDTESASRSKAVDNVNETENELKEKLKKEGKEYTKQEFQKSSAFNSIFSSINLNGGAINNYIKSLGMSLEKTKKVIEQTRDRLLNYDPQAERKTGSKKEITIGEAIMSNVGFAKLDANKELFKESEEKKKTKSIDELGEDIEDVKTTPTSRPKGQKARILRSLADINIDNKEVISSIARAEINALIEQNPKNLEEKISKIIDKEITKAVKAQMGKISNVKGEVIISEEYKAFIALNYENIVKSLDVTTIKNNYKTLFELTEIGKEDRKTRKSDKPSLKKDSNYRKGIFKIETNKAKFTKFFTEGGYTTLLARQKGLANLIAKGIVENVVSNEIIEKSNNNDVVIDAKLKNYVKKLNRQKDELQGNYEDIVKFSKTKARKAVNDGMFLADLIAKNKGVQGVYQEGVYPPRLINNPRKISVEMQEFVFNEIYADGNLTQLTPQELKGISTAKILQKAGRIYANTNNGAIYEQFIIDVAQQIPGIHVLSTTMAEGGIPDLHVRMHGKDFFVEVKMANAQYSSITVSDYDISKGKWTIKKQYDFNPQINALVKKASKGVKAAQKFVNDSKIPDPVTGKPFVWKKFGDPIPKQVVQMLKDEGLYTSMSTFDVFEIDNIGEMYRGKKYPVHYIHIQGKGLFHMGENPLKLPVPQLTGGATIKLRPVPNTQYRKVTQADVDASLAESIYTDGTNVKKKGQKKTKRDIETGYTTLTYRAIPIIDAKSVPKSDFSIGNNLEFNELMQTKEVKFLEQQEQARNRQTLGKAVSKARSEKHSKTSKGITVLDFDDTLATSKSLIRYTKPDGSKGTLTPEEYASTYQDLQDLGYEFDFSEFNKVVDGKIAPLFQKALKLQSKFGPENMFVLTARPAESAPAIFAFIKANGLNIPLKNITGLANSTSEAKALWIAGKVGEGFNDFYFADDALQNVQAVKNMLDQFDVKSKVQQAKVKFSKTMNKDFNDILEDVVGIESEKRFARTKARKRGANKGKFRFFIPPSHEDFVGLLYNFMGKGREGDAHRDFLEQALVRPLNRANKELDAARQSIANDYKNLNKAFPDVKNKLAKKTPDGDFTYQDAIRVYLWNKNGYEIPGLSPIDKANLVELVEQDTELRNYADYIEQISKQDNYVSPTDGWESGDIRMDLDDATGRVGRAQFFEEFQENADIIFSEENLNKIEAGYGSGVREALEDILYRIKTGRNRPSGQNALVNRLMNYINGAVGSVMFFNIRSSLLQQMSIVNYINFADNNIFMAAKAFANQKQYWADWSFIFNSDMLKQRRGGIQTDVNGAELAETISKSKYPIRTLIRKLLQLGFLPTQIGDNIAIATGGAMYYRNRINTYLKQGLSQKEAEAKAFTDFQDITQSTQQSARPDMVSQQQASPIGKLILAFQNVTSQFNRLGKKAFQDIKNRRITPPNTNQFQSDISNMSRIGYYFAVQNLIFYSLQTALFAALFDDDEDEKSEKFFTKKKERLLQGTLDSVLRGSGMIGAVISTLKNMAIKFSEQRGKSYNPDESSVILEMFNLSPPLGIKARKIVNAEKTLNYNKKVMKEMETFDIDNPVWSAVTSYIEGITNAPLNRMYNKTMNVRQALDNQNSAIQRALMMLGWSQYNLGIENTKIEDVKKEIKKQKKKSKSKSTKTNTKSRKVKR